MSRVTVLSLTQDRLKWGRTQNEAAVCCRLTKRKAPLVGDGARDRRYVLLMWGQWSCKVEHTIIAQFETRQDAEIAVEHLVQQHGIAHRCIHSGRRRGVFRSLQELRDAIHRFLDDTNADPKPFTWTKDPNKIIAAVKRGYQVLDSIH